MVRVGWGCDVIQFTNQIICGNCAVVMAEWPLDSISLTVTSPPYDNLRDYEGYDFDFEAIAAQLWRVTRPGGVVIWIVGDATVDGTETGSSFRQALHFMELGFRLHDTMIYEKAGFTYPDQSRYNQIFEYMFVLSKGKPRVFNPIRDKINVYAGTKVARRRQGRGRDGKVTENSAWKHDRERKVRSVGKRVNIWRYAVGGNVSSDKFVFQHPAIFPEDLAKDHIRSWSEPGDLELDPMCGSGTVPKMALQAGRQYIGIDTSEKYCKLSRRRVAGAQPPLFLEDC